MKRAPADPRLRFSLALVLIVPPLLLCLGCAGASRGAQHPDPLRVDYRVEFAADLRGGSTELCFVGQPPTELGPIAGVGPELSGPVVVTRGGRGPLPRVHGRVQLGALPRDACVAYPFELPVGGFAGVRRESAVLTSQDLWLLRPPGSVSATLALGLPPGVEASLPWGGGGARRELPASALLLAGHVALGSFTRITSRVGPNELDVSILPGRLLLDAPALARSIGAAMEAVSTVHGHFPAASLDAVVVPIGSDVDRGESDAIAFGLVRRGGGASVMFLVREDATEASVRAHWVPTHELSHLLLPLLGQRDTWISEGFATYYQEVARARASLESEQEAWTRLVDGFRRGALDAATDPDSALDDAAFRMRQTGHFYRAYWSGAAFAFSADVRLRSRAQPTSLDALLCAAEPEFRAQATVASGALVARRFDSLLGAAVFMPLRTEWAARRDFPDISGLLEALGVHVVSDGTVTLVDSAPLASIRHAIMDPRTAARARLEARRASAGFSGGSCR